MDGPDGRRRNPYELTEETPVYVISVAAQLSGLHPQTLRQYDRLGLVSPDRTAGPRAAATRPATSNCSARCSSCPRTRASTSPASSASSNWRTRSPRSRRGSRSCRPPLDGAAAAMQQREAAVHASYRRDLVPYQEVQQTSALVVWRPKPKRRD